MQDGHYMLRHENIASVKCHSNNRHQHGIWLKVKESVKGYKNGLPSDMVKCLVCIVIPIYQNPMTLNSC